VSTVKRLTKRIKMLIPETECCIPKRVICGFERTVSRWTMKGDKKVKFDG